LVKIEAKKIYKSWKSEIDGFPKYKPHSHRNSKLDANNFVCGLKIYVLAFFVSQQFLAQIIKFHSPNFTK